MNATKLGIFGGIGILAFLALQSSRLARFAKEFQLSISGRVHKVTVTNVTLAIDITFINPTDAVLKLKHPTIYIYDSDPAKTKGLTPIITSTVSAKQYTIQPNGQTKLDPVYVELSVTNFSLLSSIYAIVKRILAKQPASLWVRALSQVNSSIPVEQTQVVVINGLTK